MQGRKGFREGGGDSIATYTVVKENTLLSFLFAELAPRKNTVVKKLLKHGQVAVNGMPCTQFDYTLHIGDQVEVNFTRAFVVLQHRRVKIVYEDADILVIEKGYGLLSVGTGTKNKETAYNILKDYLKLKSPDNKLFVIHRLDRDTSGLMMFAKNIEAKEAMQHNWNNMVLSRKYLAVVEGRPSQEKGVVSSYLKENNVMSVYSVREIDPEAKKAVTRYRVLSTGGGYSTVELELETGRKNQIRVHMKDLGTPIAGDRKYGAGSSPFHRLALHAMTLRFIHPVTRKMMDFVSKPNWRSR